MRRLSNYDSLQGGDSPGGNVYNRTPDAQIHENAKRKLKKRKRINRQDMTEQDAIGNRGKNRELNRQHQERPGDSKESISNTFPMGWTRMTGPGFEYSNGNMYPDAGIRSMPYVNTQSKLSKRYGNDLSNLSIKWTNIIENPVDPTAFVYMQLAYLFQEMMYDITDLVVYRQLPSEPIVVFVHQWLNNNPLVRQTVRYCGSDFAEGTTYVELIKGLYNLRERLSNIHEYDHSFNINLRNQRSFY